MIRIVETSTRKSRSPFALGFYENPVALNLSTTVTAVLSSSAYISSHGYHGLLGMNLQLIYHVPSLRLCSQVHIFTNVTDIPTTISDLLLIAQRFF